jgi:hypothetical protein
MFPAMRLRLFFQIILLIAMCDMFGAAGAMIGFPEDGSNLCDAQGKLTKKALLADCLEMFAENLCSFPGQRIVQVVMAMDNCALISIILRCKIRTCRSDLLHNAFSYVAGGVVNDIASSYSSTVRAR